MSRTTRTTRPTGHRARPRQSRCQQGPVRPAPRSWPRACHQGRARGSSWASSRCSTITERMSCSVAANRNSLTRRARRPSGSRATLPAPAKPTPATTNASPPPRNASHDQVSGRSATRASCAVGAVARPAATSRSDHATRRSAIELARRRDIWVPDAMRAAPHAVSATSAPAATPAAIQPARSPPSRPAVTLPATAPAIAGTSTTPRSCRAAAARSTVARGIGASRRYMTSAGSGASGPPCAPERSPSATITAMPSPSTPAALSRIVAIVPASTVVFPRVTVR